MPSDRVNQTSIPATRRVGIPPGTRALRIDRQPNAWRLWIHASPDFQYGTFLMLYDNGRIVNETWRPDGDDEAFEVRPADME